MLVPPVKVLVPFRIRLPVPALVSTAPEPVKPAAKVVVVLTVKVRVGPLAPRLTAVVSVKFRVPVPPEVWPKVMFRPDPTIVPNEFATVRAAESVD